MATVRRFSGRQLGKSEDRNYVFALQEIYRQNESVLRHAGRYSVVMGNSGGDNRVEFGTRLDHSIWYESPKFANVFSFDALISPGQNRTYNNVVQSSGSPDCNGGNQPGSGKPAAQLRRRWIR